jgi:hypothetical protein
MSAVKRVDPQLAADDDDAVAHGEGNLEALFAR